MQFRVTVGIGQDSVDPAVLDDRAAALRHCVTGGAVLVDLVKAALQLVLPIDAQNALAAIQQAVHITEQGIREAGLDWPASIAVIEAESVTAAAAGEDLRPHEPGQ